MSLAPAAAEPASFESLWSATAPAAPATPPFDAAASHPDVIVIGGGLMGLSTALHLAEQGVTSCVLEARSPGWGASGRNGGQVIPGLKLDPLELIARYGKERAEPLIDMAGAAADAVFDVIDRHAIDCEAVRAGWIQPAHSHRSMDGLVERVRQWRDRGAAVDVLDREEVRARLGTDAYVGGWIDRRAGSIQPLSYVRGLLRAALGRGVKVHGDSPVARLRRTGSVWEATTDSGASVRAPQVVIATNAYTDDLWPHLKQTVLPAHSFIVATAPLDASASRDVLPGGVVASDSRRLLLYFRRDAHGRFLLGGRGPLREPRGSADWSHLIRSVAWLYPALRGVPIDYRWAGRVAVTMDSMPHVHVPAPGLIAALGCNGRGVAMSTQLGRHLALLIARQQELPLPITDIRPIPLHRARRLYMGLGVAYYAMRDKFG